MKIVYHCYGGAHSSPIAACIHVGILPHERLPSSNQLMEAPCFDKVGPLDRGKLFFIGRDGYGNEVFMVGRGPEPKGIINGIRSGSAMAGLTDEDFLFVDTLPNVNWWMRVGGYLSRGLRWISVGRPIVIYGTKRAYPELVATVDKVKSELSIRHAVSPPITHARQD